MRKTWPNPLPQMDHPKQRTQTASCVQHSCLQRAFRTLFEVNSRARRPEQPSLTSDLMAGVLLVSRPFVKAVKKQSSSYGPAKADETGVWRGSYGKRNAHAI
jgi:hypothetical protein